MFVGSHYFWPFGTQHFSCNSGVKEEFWRFPRCVSAVSLRLLCAKNLLTNAPRKGRPEFMPAERYAAYATWGEGGKYPPNLQGDEGEKPKVQG